VFQINLIFLNQSSLYFQANPPGPPEEDEDYEVLINDLNLVWSVDLKTNELIPDESFWGSAPKYELLEDTTRVLVFDFGSEVYVWNGRSAPFETRRLGIKLAKDLWEKGLEGTAPVEGHPLIPKGTKRPSWAILGKVNQNMETILFREKFLNWPDKSRLIKEKENVGKKKIVTLTSTNDDQVKLSTDVERNFEISEMVSWPLQEPNIELEMTFLGRGRSYYDEAERRQYEIETLSTKVCRLKKIILIISFTFILVENFVHNS
jgi:supervillin